jgi:hypothetical protein
MVNNSIGGEKTKKPINSGNRLQQLTEKASQTGSQPVQAGSGPRKCRTGSAEMSGRVSGSGSMSLSSKIKKLYAPTRGLSEDFR